MTALKSEAQIEIIKEGGAKLHKVLAKLVAAVKPGKTGADLDKLASFLIRKEGGEPSFLNYRGFPASICVSIDSDVVHGVPDLRKFSDGNLVSIDVGMFYRGLYTDAAVTVPVGKVSPEDKRLVKVTEESLINGIKAAKPGNKISDIGRAVEETVKKANFSVVRDLVGHGVGFAVHEDPEVPNYFRARDNMVLTPGLVLAIEPMVNAGKHQVTFGPDGFAIRTKDGSKSAHFEHTIAILEKGSIILT